MRVALVGPVHPWRGGIAQYLGLLGESLMPRAEVRGVTFTRQYPGFLFPGERQHDPAAEPPRFPVEACLDSIGPWSWRATARRLEAFAPGIVILKWWLPFFGPAFASAVGPLRGRGTRVMLVCDNLIPHERRPFDMAFTRWMLRNSDGYLVMSESVERDLDRLKRGAPRRRVLHPLYAQFDRGRYTRESARARLGLDGEVAVFFGYVRRYKGLDTLLEAYAGIDGAELWIVGNPRMDVEPLRSAAARARGPVRFLTRFIEDAEIPSILRRADVLVLPYRDAEQSGVLYTGLAFGKPMVLSEVGGFGEVAAHSAARLVPPDDPPALAAALEHLVGDEAERGALAAAAAAAAAGPYSWDSAAEKTLALYGELLERREEAR